MPKLNCADSARGLIFACLCSVLLTGCNQPGEKRGGEDREKSSYGQAIDKGKDVDAKLGQRDDDVRKQADELKD
jgi:uncharacterized lipoprotein YehR (DUF1307 family)